MSRTLMSLFLVTKDNLPQIILFYVLPLLYEKIVV